MTDNSTWTAWDALRLRHAPGGVRALVTCFVLTMTAGYAVALTNVARTAGFGADSVAAYYRGDPEQMLFEKTFGELMATTHAHAYGMPILFVLIGACFVLTGVAERVKASVIIVAFVALVGDLASFWVVRYVAPGFVWMSLLTSTLMLLTFLVMVAAALWEMWGPPSRTAAPQDSS